MENIYRFINIILKIQLKNFKELYYIFKYLLNIWKYLKMSFSIYKILCNIFKYL